MSLSMMSKHVRRLSQKDESDKNWKTEKIKIRRKKERKKKREEREKKRDKKRNKAFFLIYQKLLFVNVFKILSLIKSLSTIFKLVNGLNIIFKSKLISINLKLQKVQKKTYI